jgi:hypothetical protein
MTFQGSFTEELARIRAKDRPHFSTRDLGREIEFAPPANDPFGRTLCVWCSCPLGPTEKGDICEDCAHGDDREGN